MQDYIQHEVGLWFRSKTLGQNSNEKSVTYSIINHRGGGEYGFSSGPEKHPVFIVNQEISHHCYVKPRTESKIQSKLYDFNLCQSNVNI